MRPPVTLDTLREVRRVLGRAARSPGRIYIAGGATALELGVRASTLDIDLSMAPEPEGVFQAIADAKRRLSVNIELASPADFVPALPGWEERSIFIERVGEVDFFHFDPYTQALSKLARGLGKDIADVEALVVRELVDPVELRRLFERARDQLVRYPGLDATGLEAAVARLAGGDTDGC